MGKNWISKIIIFLSATFMLSCAATSGTSDLGLTQGLTPSSTDTGATQATETTEIVEPEAGTFVGNGKPVTSLKLAMNSTDTLSDDMDVLNPYSEELAHCEVRDLQKKHKDTHSLRCHFSGKNYKIQIASIALAACTDAHGTEAVCEPPFNGHIAAKTPIYSGPAVNMTLSNQPQEFSGTLTLPTTTVRASGLFITTEYVSQDFPSAEDNDAANVITSLHGKSYLFCLVDTANPANTGLACGNTAAQSGDLLFDLNGDGIHSFLNIGSDDTLSETTTRPTKYIFDHMIDEDKLIFLKQIFIPFGKISEISASTGLDLSAIFYAKNQTIFGDGEYWQGEKPTQSAEESFNGIYDPSEDRVLFPINPYVSVQFNQ